MRIERLPCALLVALAGMLTGCATPDRIVLLPQPDGSPSAIIVQSKGGAEAVLSQPYATAVVTDGRLETTVSSADEVRARYQALFDALPARPKGFLLYFEAGGDQLTPESEGRLDEILSEVKKLPAPELVVIGHTDTVGSDSVNDEISMRRAGTVRARLAAKGIDATRIEVVGRGKREPLVPTGDGVAEPRNRRVEIRLR